MTLGDLLYSLGIGVVDEEDPLLDKELKFAMQPQWPLQYSVGSVLTADEIGSDDEDGADTDYIYLVARDQDGYLPGAVAEAAGWQ